MLGVPGAGVPALVGEVGVSLGDAAEEGGLLGALEAVVVGPVAGVVGVDDGGALPKFRREEKGAVAVLGEDVLRLLERGSVLV